MKKEDILTEATEKILKLKSKILELEEQLKNAKECKFGKTNYIHETSNLYCIDGEMHIEYGEGENQKCLIYNTDQLFKDLPFIINQVVKENKKMQDMHLREIKDELKEL